MNRAFGLMLHEMVMLESPSREHQQHSKQQISVEEIVYKEKLAYMNQLSEAKIEVKKLLHSSTLSKRKTFAYGKTNIRHCDGKQKQ